VIRDHHRNTLRPRPDEVVILNPPDSLTDGVLVRHLLSAPRQAKDKSKTTMNGSLAAAHAAAHRHFCACSFAPVYKTPDSVPAASGYQGGGRDWKPAATLEIKPRDLVDAISGSAAGCTGKRRWRRQPGFAAAFARLQQARAPRESRGPI